MAITRVDEVLGKALETDATVIPRYDLKDVNGNIVVANATLTLKNPVVVEGMPVNKPTIDECLAASGVTTGTSDAFILDQTGFTLFDGATIRFRLHLQMNKGATINVTNTGAKNMVDANGKGAKAIAGSWLTAVYSSATGNFILQGSGGGVKRPTTWQRLMTNKFI